jgi:hypothetical protein
MGFTEEDLKRLRTQIQKMSYKDPLYRLLKQELSKKGHWKNKARGDGGNPQHFFLAGRGKAKGQAAG